MNKHYRNDDNAFDERGLLRDGRVYRAKLTMMDHDLTPDLPAAAGLSPPLLWSTSAFILSS
jgi:hypothetical protein